MRDIVAVLLFLLLFLLYCFACGVVLTYLRRWWGITIPHDSKLFGILGAIIFMCYRGKIEALFHKFLWK